MDLRSVKHRIDSLFTETNGFDTCNTDAVTWVPVWLTVDRADSDILGILTPTDIREATS